MGSYDGDWVRDTNVLRLNVDLNGDGDDEIVELRVWDGMGLEGRIIDGNTIYTGIPQLTIPNSYTEKIVRLCEDDKSYGVTAIPTPIDRMGNVAYNQSTGQGFYFTLEYDTDGHWDTIEKKVTYFLKANEGGGFTTLERMFDEIIVYEEPGTDVLSTIFA